MKCTADPRCPKHHDMEVYLEARPRPNLWVCSVCRRPLGLSTVHRDFGIFLGRWPPHRRPAPSNMSLSAVDWGWILRDDDVDDGETLPTFDGQPIGPDGVVLQVEPGRAYKVTIP